MMITISLHYPIDEENTDILDIWNLEAPNKASVERMVHEYLAPALRRHGRRRALEHGVTEPHYSHKWLYIEINETLQCSVSQLCEEIAGDQPSLNLTDQHLAKCLKPSARISHIPTTLNALLSKHGFLEPDGGKRKCRPKTSAPNHIESVDDPPPF